ncbi:MAG: DUF4388 domain-containing protein [Bdellovibrionales bacterium]|nr:DUF4388 domain-containing protein [Bdellovibrionales bacterium]
MGYVKKTPLEGNLQEVWLPHIFIKILMMNLTGVLILELQDRKSEVFFRKGNVVHIKSNHKEDRFGQFLVKLGVLQETDVEEVLRKQKMHPDVKFGDLLVKEQIIDAQKMLKYLNEHHAERLYYVFEHKIGSYRYVKSSQWTEDVSAFEMPTHKIYFEAVERFYSIEEIQSYTEINDDVFLQKNKNHRIEFPLPPIPSKVLYSIHENISVANLIKKVLLPREKIYPILFILIIANWIEMVSDERGTRKIHTDKKVSAIVKHQIDLEYPNFLKKNYFEIFSVPLQFNPQKVQTNFFELIKKYSDYKGTEKGDQILIWIKIGYQILMSKALRIHYIKRLKMLDGNRDKIVDDRTFFHGLYLLTQEKQDEAMHKFKIVSEKHAKDPLYRSYFLGVQYMLNPSKENLQEALKEFEERQNLVRNESYLTVAYASMLLATKKEKDAERILASMIEREGGHPQGQVLLDEIRFKRAKVIAEQAEAAKKPDSVFKKIFLTPIGGSDEEDDERELSDETPEDEEEV